MVVEFKVKVQAPGPTGGPVVRWFGSDGELVDDAESAFTFQTSTSATMRERIQILRRMESIAGGAEELYQLRADVADVGAAARARAESAMDPELERGSPAWLEAWTAAWAKAWSAAAEWEAEAYDALRGTLDRVEFLATWGVLVRRCPPALEKLEDSAMNEGAFYALWGAWRAAVSGAEPGKSPPSGR